MLEIGQFCKVIFSKRLYFQIPAELVLHRQSLASKKLILNYVQLNVMNRTSNIDLENYVPNGEWELLEARLVRTEQYYPCCIEPYPSMTVTIR